MMGNFGSIHKSIKLYSILFYFIFAHFYSLHKYNIGHYVTNKIYAGFFVKGT